MRLLLVEGEDNETRLVFLQALGISLDALGALVGATVIDRNTNSPSFTAVDVGCLELLQGKPTAQSQFGIVPN